MSRGLLLVEKMRPKSPGSVFGLIPPVFDRALVEGTALKLLDRVGKVHVIEQIEELGVKLDVP